MMQQKRRYRDKIKIYPCVSRPDLIQAYEGKVYEVQPPVPKLFRNAPFLHPDPPEIKSFSDFIDQYCYTQQLTQVYQKNVQKFTERIFKVRQKMKDSSYLLLPSWRALDMKLTQELLKIIKLKQSFDRHHSAHSEFYLQLLQKYPDKAECLL